jgi:sugar lactone lactonase YvrE
MCDFPSRLARGRAHAATEGSVGAERCANLCFGGRKRNRLFMAASQSVYSVYVNTQGVSVYVNTQGVSGG